MQRGPEDPEHSSEEIAAFCEELVQYLGLDLQVGVSEEAGVVCVNLGGPDRPFLLSSAASLLNAIEYLLNKVFRFGKEDSPGIIVDSEKYRAHRESELVLLAQMASQKVLASRRALSLQPMVPRERRIVHLALAEIAGVRSQSAGDGDNRSITIFPS
jgi:spoIIIJ-associated protein